MSFKSACIHEGRHVKGRIGKQGQYDWNRDLASKMTRDLQTSWDITIEKSVDSTANRLMDQELQKTYDQIHQLFEEVLSHAKGRRNTHFPGLEYMLTIC